MDSIDCRHESDAQTTEKTKQSGGPFVKAPVWRPGRGSGPELGAAARGRRGRATGLLGGPWLRALIRPRLPPSSSAGREGRGLPEDVCSREKQDGRSANVLDALRDAGVGQ